MGDTENTIRGLELGADESLVKREFLARVRSMVRRAKSSDTFTPAGPYIETELDPHNVRVTGRINGKEVQSEITTYLIFDIPTIMEFVTEYVTLEPGDMIYTGTPGEPQEMHDGDVCEIEIEGIGVLSNPIKLEK